MVRPTGANIKETVIFLTTYSLVGLIGFGANLGMFALLLSTGVYLSFATGLAFLFGGQVAFVCHDNITFGRRVVTLPRWQDRWKQMMLGQMFGFMTNYAVANSLILIERGSTSTVYLAATVCGASVTCAWANYRSHKKEPNTDPAESAEEHALE
jgi:putative flippase GtrA